MLMEVRFLRGDEKEWIKKGVGFWRMGERGERKEIKLRVRGEEYERLERMGERVNI